jgi:peptidoglycan/xylan/chitin deacetylase (PgdA/CDA1 family)
MYIFMSHDVDWPRSGPGIAHILARGNRFDESILQRAKNEQFNPYHGIPYIANIEKDFRVRSTFFFRPTYDDSQTVAVYEDEIKDLLRDGWEVGLHINNAESLDSIAREKDTLEKVAGTNVLGSRVHYLRILPEKLPLLHKAGFLYDSSLSFSKDRFDLRNTGYLNENDGLIVFPITFMDAYLFSYSHLNEQNVIEFIVSNLLEAQKSETKFATILWHDNAILMRGGRVYRQLLEKLVQMEDVILTRGIDAYRLASSDKRNAE